MASPRFEYYAPTSVSEAIRLLEELGSDARVMAGGTDLLIKMQHGQIMPKAIIGLKRIPELNGIVFKPGDGLYIGATVLLADVVEHPDIVREYPTIAYAARCTANVQIRNMGTLAGNLCNASPSADNAPTLLAMGAQLAITGPNGDRKLPLEDFFKGPGITALEPTEIVTSIYVPILPKQSGVAYHPLSARGQLDCAAVNVAAMMVMDGQTCQDVRIFVGACGPTPMRTPEAEALLRGKKPTDPVIGEAAQMASNETKPIDDVRSSARYRTKMVAVMTQRALLEARQKAMAQP